MTSLSSDIDRTVNDLLHERVTTEDLSSLSAQVRALIPLVDTAQQRLLGTLAAGEVGHIKQLLKNIEAAFEGGAAELDYPRESYRHSKPPQLLVEDLVSSLADTPEEDLTYTRNILDDINDAIGDITAEAVSKLAKLTKKAWKHNEPVVLAALPMLHAVSEILRNVGDAVDAALHVTASTAYG